MAYFGTWSKTVIIVPLQVLSWYPWCKCQLVQMQLPKESTSCSRKRGITASLDASHTNPTGWMLEMLDDRAVFLPTAYGLQWLVCGQTMVGNRPESGYSTCSLTSLVHRLCILQLTSRFLSIDGSNAPQAGCSYLLHRYTLQFSMVAATPRNIC